jgi:hypothetical protein
LKEALEEALGDGVRKPWAGFTAQERREIIAELRHHQEEVKDD